MALRPLDHTCETRGIAPTVATAPYHPARHEPPPHITRHGWPAEEIEMRSNGLILLALAVVTAANTGCCGSCRNWLNRGSLCGTKTAAPAMMGSPVALGTPYVQQPQYMQPQMAAPMQQMVMPQANCQCAPQCVPQCIPQCQPCCDPCMNMCSPCGSGGWSGGYMDSGSMDSGCCGGATTDSGYESGTMVPSTGQPTLPSTTYAPQGGSSLTDPGPAPATVNFPESTKPSE